MLRPITSVKPLENFELLLTFKGGQQRLYDMKPHLDIGIFVELREPKMFNTVRVSFDTVEWANGADLDPESLYNGSRPVKTTTGKEQRQTVD